MIASGLPIPFWAIHEGQPRPVVCARSSLGKNKSGGSGGAAGRAGGYPGGVVLASCAFQQVLFLHRDNRRHSHI